MGESIQDWKNSFDSLEDIMIIINKDYTIEKINKKGLELLGKKEKDVVGCKCYEIIHNVDGPGDYCPFKKTLESKKVESTERYEKVFDKYFSIKSSPIFNPKGEIVKFVDLMRDITDQKKTEKKLLKSKTRLKNIFNQNFQFMGILSVEGDVLAVNQTALNFIDIEESEIIGKPFWDTPWWSHSEKLQKWLKNAILKTANGEIVRKEVTHLSDKNKLHYFDFSLKPVYNNNVLLYIIAESRDITKRKRTEDKLKKNEERYHSIFENTGTATSIFGDDRVIIKCNSAFEKLSGYSKKDIEGKKRWDDFIPEPDRKRMMKYHKQRSIGVGAPPTEYDCDFINNKGELRTVHVKISVMPSTKERVFSLLDITDRKKSEEKIKKSLKEKETLLKEIHHRVKNNLQIVSTMLKLQSDFTDDKNLLGKFKESQNRIQSIALVHERLYKSENLAEIDFDEYLKDFMVDISHSYKDKDKTIDWDCICDDISLDVSTGIPCALIINELVSNSFNHAFTNKNQGQIDIALKHNKNKKEYRLKVRDDGQGLPANFDLEKSSSLGLQLVNNLVDQFDGKINYYNDSGAVFEIAFEEKNLVKKH